MTEATKANDSPVLAAALRYAAQGLPVFPCRNEPTNEKRHKTPLTKHGFKDAKAEAETVRRWWRRWPDALIGMPTGKVTGIAVLDLDKKKGKDGFAAVPTGRGARRSLRAHHQAGRTSTSRTPTGCTAPTA